MSYTFQYTSVPQLLMEYQKIRAEICLNYVLKSKGINSKYCVDTTQSKLLGIIMIPCSLNEDHKPLQCPTRKNKNNEGKENK